MRVLNLGLFSLLPATIVASDAVNDERFWAQWRGPRMAGISPSGKPPIEWSESRNVAWKIRLPGHGSSTPVIWEDRLYVLTAVPAEGEAVRPDEVGDERRGVTSTSEAQQIFKVLALRRSDGSVVWERTANRAVPHEGKQQNNSYASGSAVTDGTHVLAYFGSWGLYCYDLEGNLIWSKDFGTLRTRGGFGEGTSPALFEGTVVVQWDSEDESFIVALEKATGEERWRRSRDEVTSWATPLVVPHAGRTQVIATGERRVMGYDLETGELIWEGDGLTLNAIPSPVEHGGIVYVTSGFRGNRARAIRLSEAKGDITGASPAVLWELDRDTPYVPSPLFYEGLLYLIKSNSAILTTLDAATGRAHYGPVRLPGLSEVYASPTGVNGNVVILGRDGNALVLKNGPELTIVARNSLADGFDASPAIVGNEMYLRGYRYLYKIAAE
jgi:outer membrane protein assembly factor BamB